MITVKCLYDNRGNFLGFCCALLVVDNRIIILRVFSVRWKCVGLQKNINCQLWSADLTDPPETNKSRLPHSYLVQRAILRFIGV